MKNHLAPVRAAWRIWITKKAENRKEKEENRNKENTAALDFVQGGSI